MSLDFLLELPSVSEQEESFLLLFIQLLRKVFSLFLRNSFIFSTCWSQAVCIFSYSVSSSWPSSKQGISKSAQRGKRMWVGKGSLRVVRRGESCLKKMQSCWLKRSKQSRLLSWHQNSQSNICLLQIIVLSLEEADQFAKIYFQFQGFCMASYGFALLSALLSCAAFLGKDIYVIINNFWRPRGKQFTRSSSIHYCSYIQVNFGQ